MRITILWVLCSMYIVSCEVSGVKEQEKNTSVGDSVLHINSKEKSNEVHNDTSSTETEERKVVDKKEFDNGIKIEWITHGEGEQISKNDLVAIDYRLALEDGTIYDGNHLVRRPSVPFLVGWGLQTDGWDFGLLQLNEGDEVELFIPSELARGEKGIPGVVPPNSNNIMYLHVKRIMKPDHNVDGIRIWTVEKGKKRNDTIKIGDKVVINYWASSESNPRYDNSYKRGEPFELVMGDGNIVPGLYKALHFAKKGDKVMIHIPAKEGYGSKGLKDMVLPNEDLFYDIIVMDVIPESESEL